MITIKNIQTGEVKNVYNTEFVNGYVKSNTGKPLGKRFANSWAGILTETTDEDGQQVFSLSADWEVVTGKGERKQRQPKAKKGEKKAEPKAQEEPTKDEQRMFFIKANGRLIDKAASKQELRDKASAFEKTLQGQRYKKEYCKYDEADGFHFGYDFTLFDEPQPETTAQTEDDTTNEQALIAAIKNLRGGQVDDAKVRTIFAEELAKLAEPQRSQVSRIATKVAKKEGQVYHDNFDDVKARIARGQWVYLYGPTGSGKNVLAEQIADALGLPFHYQAHCSDRFELTGFIDANGNYQATEFYKAYTEGGLFMLDELDASDENALITLNSAANGYFAFPCGTMKAHPDFRCIAAGNTCGRGATDDYTGRRVMDVSSIGRFMPRYHNYSDVIDLHDAEGNTDLVEFIHVMRDAKKATGTQIIASPRQIKEIVADEKDGLNLTQTLTDVFAAYLTEDDLNIVKQFVKNDARMSGNKYAKAFAKVQAVVY